MSLHALIEEAKALAGPEKSPCAGIEHDWVTEGGRACPHGGDASQTVYRCRRCGDYDYGEPGGPGWQDCENDECGCDRRLW